MPDQEPQTHDAASELASFGEELRREREIRGISLKEIADATKISKRFLEALERNDHKSLPAIVFTRGFVREYARYVGLNAEEMVNRYNFAAANDDRIEKPPTVAKYAQTPPRDISPKPPAKLRTSRAPAWFVPLRGAPPRAGSAVWTSTTLAQPSPYRSVTRPWAGSWTCWATRLTKLARSTLKSAGAFTVQHLRSRNKLAATTCWKPASR